MFKLLSVLIIAFFALWFFQKHYIPDIIRESGVGRTVNAVLLPAEYEINKTLGFDAKKVPSMVEINSQRLRSLVSSINGLEKNVIIFLYNTDCFLCRYVIRDINDLAKKYKGSKDLVFLVIAFEDDKEKLTFMLSDIGNLYFRPIYTKAANISDFEAEFSKFNIRAGKIPVVITRNTVTKQYENLTTDFSTKGIIIKKLDLKE